MHLALLDGSRPGLVPLPAAALDRREGQERVVPGVKIRIWIEPEALDFGVNQSGLVILPHAGAAVHKG